MASQSNDLPNFEAYRAICFKGVRAVVVTLGGQCPETGSLADALKVFDFQRSRLNANGASGVADRLHISKQQIETFTTALRRAAYLTQKKFDEHGNGDPNNTAIAYLRLIDQLDAIREANPDDPQFAINTIHGSRYSEVGTPDVSLQQQVRALELIIRSLVNEAYGSQDRLRAHFESINKAAVEKWARDADKGDLLSGSLFGDLVSIFVNKDEYSANYKKLFEDTPFLTFLEEKRATLQVFLDDVRSARNRVAHHKQITPVQITLLDLYYTEIVAPLRQAFDVGRTQVNPDSFCDVTKQELEKYFDHIRSKLDALGDGVDEIKTNLGEIQQGIAHIGGGVDWLRGKMIWALAGLLAIGLIGVATLGTSTKTLQNTGDIKHGVTDIDNKMDNVKQETSSDPQKELANLGVNWDEGYGPAVGSGNRRVVELYLRAGVTDDSAPGYEDRTLLSLIINKRYNLLDLFHKYNFFATKLDCERVLGNYSDNLPSTSPELFDYNNSDSMDVTLDVNASKAYKSMCKNHIDVAKKFFTDASNDYEINPPRVCMDASELQTALIQGRKISPCRNPNVSEAAKWKAHQFNKQSVITKFKSLLE